MTSEEAIVVLRTAIEEQVFGSGYRAEVTAALDFLETELYGAACLDEEREAEIARLVESAREGWQAHADEEARAARLEQERDELIGRLGGTL